MLWAIEIKRTSSPKVERGFHSACDDIKPTQRFVVYNGDETYPIPNGITAIGLIDMMKKLKEM